MMRAMLATVAVASFGMIGCAGEITHEPGKTGDPALTLVQASQAGVVARYRQGAEELVLRAVRDGDAIESTFARADGTVLTQLRIPDGDPDLYGLFQEAADSAVDTVRTLAPDADQFAALKKLYMDAANAIHAATPELDESPLRYALPYHSAVLDAMGAPLPNATGYAAATCTPCTEGGTPTHCAESHQVVEYMFAAYPGMRGCDTGCCGNYQSQCLYANIICYAHDLACYNCGHWWCFSGCKPGLGC